MLGDTKVTRVRTEFGHTHEPSFDQNWSPLMQLRWMAAVESIDIAPLRIEVKSAVGSSQVNGVTIPEVAYYVTVPGSGFGAGGKTFNQAWAFIINVSLGIQMERRWAERAAKPAVEKLLNETTPIFDRLATPWAPAIVQQIRIRNQFGHAR